MTDLHHQVREFFEVAAAHQERHSVPTVPTRETVRLRLRMIAEEFWETMTACGDVVTEDQTGGRESMAEWLKDSTMDFVDNMTLRVDLPEFADGLADLDYVVEGARVAFGIDGRPIAGAVHLANLTKATGPIVDGKRLKPEGFRPPDIAGELRKQGWKG